MNNLKEIKQQRNYWNKQLNDFEAIYTKKKSGFSVWLDKVFRRDMFDRFVYTVENCKPVGSRVFLDIGCGTGLYSIELAKLGAKKVIGIDIAEKMVETSKMEAKSNNVLDRCEFHHSDLLEYKPKEEINVSFGIGLFDYIKDPLPVMKKMFDISKDSAIFAFPRLGTWRMPVRKVRLTLRGCDVYFFSKSKVEKLLQIAGFKKYRIDKVGKLFCAIGYKD
jgi:predicted RNA methylase